LSTSLCSSWASTHLPVHNCLPYPISIGFPQGSATYAFTSFLLAILNMSSMDFPFGSCKNTSALMQRLQSSNSNKPRSPYLQDLSLILSFRLPVLLNGQSFSLAVSCVFKLFNYLQNLTTPANLFQQIFIASSAKFYCQSDFKI